MDGAEDGMANAREVGVSRDAGGEAAGGRYGWADDAEMVRDTVEQSGQVEALKMQVGSTARPSFFLPPHPLIVD
jgi:hypothetical protein